MTDAEEIAQGSRARTDFQAFEDAFDKLRAVSLEKIIKSAPADLALRERLVVTVQIIDAIRDELLRLAGAGDAARLRPSE